MDCEFQAPRPKIEIYDYKQPNAPVIVLRPEPADSIDLCSGLISYNFGEETGSINPSFTFTIQEEERKNALTFFDRIKKLWVVKIYEGTDKAPAFVGVIYKKRQGKSFSDRGVRNSSVFSGESIAGLFARFQVAMNIRIMNIKDADAANKLLTISLNKDDLDIKTFIYQTWKDYVGLTISGVAKNEGESSEVVLGNTAVADIISNFMGDDFLELNSSDAKFHYPIANAFYQQGVNTITGIWQSILALPAYELFSRVDRSGKCKLVARETPFDKNDFEVNGISFNAKWTDLKILDIDPLRLTSYDLEQSNDEVYTAYYSYLEGSVLSQEAYVTISQLSKAGDQTLCVDMGKLALYGYRPLEVNFRGYSRRDPSTGSDGNSNVLDAFRALNERLKEWFRNLDLMYSGSITICTDFVNPNRNPRAGERIGFLGGEFYVRGVQHAWAYGGTPTITCAVNRGAKYSESGEYTGELENVGKTLIEIGLEIKH